MLIATNYKVMNFEGALRGMRNPLESWGSSDSFYDIDTHECIMGSEDHKLAMKLATAGSDHGKFLRQIFVTVDITAPLYWWKEFDTYKVGTVANSTSTMHKLGSRPLVETDFSWDNDEDDSLDCSTNRQYTLEYLNDLIQRWSACDDTKSFKKKKLWRRIIQDLPSSFNQTRTVTLDYEVLRNIYFARKNHKLSEWHTLCAWIRSLPYSELITTPRKTPREVKLEKAMREIVDILFENDTVKVEIFEVVRDLVDKTLKMEE